MGLNLDVYIDPADLDALRAGKSLTNLQRQYADWKARAMRERLAGRIGRAQYFEGVADRIFGEMPPAERW